MIGSISKNDFESYVMFLLSLSLVFPIEVGSGFYITYIFSLLLIPYLKFSLKKVALFLLFSIFCFLSTLINGRGEITSLFITIYTAFFITFKIQSKVNLKYFFIGAEVGVYMLLLLFCFAIINYGIYDPYRLLITDREWFKGIIPFVGNGLTMVLVIISYIFRDNLQYRANFISILVAFSTTSRLALLSLGSIVRTEKLYYLGVFFSVFLIGFMVVYFSELSFVFDQNSSYVQRLIKFEDRFLVYIDNINAFLSNPFFGVGPIDIGFYKHAHNSFLYILARYGIFAFIFYLGLVVSLFLGFYKLGGLRVFFPLLCMGVFQIGFQNIGVVIALSIYFHMLTGMKGGKLKE